MDYSVGSLNCTYVQETSVFDSQTVVVKKEAEEAEESSVETTRKYRKELKSDITCVVKQLQPYKSSIDLQDIVSESLKHLGYSKDEGREISQPLKIKLVDRVTDRVADLSNEVSQHVHARLPGPNRNYAIGENLLEWTQGAASREGENPYRDEVVEMGISKTTLVVSGVFTFGTVPAVVVGSEYLDKYAGDSLSEVEKFLEEHRPSDPSESLSRCLIGPEHCDLYYYGLTAKYALKGAKKITEIFDSGTKMLAQPIERMLDGLGVTDKNATNILDPIRGKPSSLGLD